MSNVPVAMERISQLRQWMEKENYSAFIIPQNDEFLSKVIAPYSERLKWISGFGGSAGTLVLTLTEAALLTDSRYSEEAAQTLDAMLFSVYDMRALSLHSWIISHVPEGGRIAYDPWLYSVSTVETHESTLKQHQRFFIPLSSNPIDSLWKDRPLPLNGLLFAHPANYAGESAHNKCQRISSTLPPSSALLLTANDCICWLLNVRGQDVPSSPLFQGYGILESSGHVHLFISLSKIPLDLKKQFEKNVTFWEISTLQKELPLLLSDKTVLYDPSENPYGLLQIAQKNARSCQTVRNPCLLPKAIKNLTELAHIREDHIADGLALVRCFYWLETSMASGARVTEWDVVEQLMFFKSHHPRYWSESFDAIVGYGLNSALIHYRPSSQGSQTIEKESLLLIDTGTQYTSGTTTDVTRTLTFGTPSSFEREIYTRVLKGHIQLARTTFPHRTKGCHLDALARASLWEKGWDYPHSTGHGVGSFLNVHEGPHSISTRLDLDPLMASMLVTIEPGYYKSGVCGVRLENMMEIHDKEAGFYHFIPLTIVHFETNMIDAALLTPDETRWLDHYHKTVYETLSPFLEDPVRLWLQTKTTRLGTSV